MTRQELKDEMKQVDGDPIVKARLRSLARDRLRKRMIAAVPRATMVIANPTHYAVALRYVRAEGGAPLVVAKGQDLIALRSARSLTQHGIPVIEDKVLARSLYKAVEVDKMIPPEFYKAVAEIVFFLFARQAPQGLPGRRADMQKQGNHLYAASAKRRWPTASRCGFRAAPDRGNRPHRLHSHRAVRQHRQSRHLIDRALFQAGHRELRPVRGRQPEVGRSAHYLLDMEFHYARVNVYFRLLLEALQAGVEIHYINFEDGSADPEQNTQQLIEAIAGARLTPISVDRPPSRRAL